MRRTSLQELRAVIIAEFPELANSEFTLLAGGWDSVAIDVGDRLIFKFPRNAEAEKRLATETRLLAVIRPAVTMPVPDLTLHPGPPLFSKHQKLAGGHLLTENYQRLNVASRERLAADLALFYAELHRLDSQVIADAGAGPIKPWLEPDIILRRAWPVLPAELRPFAEGIIEAWRRLQPDPHGITYGFFDGHGWNMAFDHARGRLNGIYDFADSGFGSLHQEPVYSNMISRDLTARIIAEYERLTGRMLDRERIDILTGAMRLSELAEYADDPAHAPLMIENVRNWAARQGS